MSASAPSAEPDPGAAPRAAPAEPLLLWKRLVEARDVVNRQRHLAVPRAGPNARDEFLSALEAYVASLVSRGRPIPYALRDELRLQRLTCSADPHRR